MILQLIRTYDAKGTNGILTKDGDVICYTIELPWRDNITRISCIPEGTYEIRKRYSKKFKAHFEITGVPNRHLILIHAANDARRELQGCIAPVMQYTGIGKGSSSGAALARLKTHLYPLLEKGDRIFLTIK